MDGKFLRLFCIRRAGEGRNQRRPGNSKRHRRRQCRLESQRGFSGRCRHEWIAPREFVSCDQCLGWGRGAQSSGAAAAGRRECFSPGRRSAARNGRAHVAINSARHIAHHSAGGRAAGQWRRASQNSSRSGPTRGAGRPVTDTAAARFTRTGPGSVRTKRGGRGASDRRQDLLRGNFVLC